MVTPLSAQELGAELQTIEVGRNRDCSPTRDCSSKITCKAEYPPLRDCNVCVLKNVPIFGKKCLVSNVDPSCEIANAAAKEAAIRRQSGCEVAKATQKLECETQKSSEKAQCEVTKQNEILAAVETEKELQTAIVQAYQSGPSPVPQEILAKLAPAFYDVLNQLVLYAGDNANITIPSALRPEFDGHGVIALQNVVLLKVPNLATTETRTWVRGFLHLREYLQWGVTGVAQAYANAPNAVSSQIDAEVEKACRLVKC